MRFIYVDSRGNEVEVASVEALAARIQLGAIVAETRLYDEAADLWAPAEAHPVYRQILREGVEPGQSMGRVSASGEMPGDAPGPVTTREDAQAAADAVTGGSVGVPRAQIPGLVGHTGTVDGTLEPEPEVAEATAGPEPANIDDLAPTAAAGDAVVAELPGPDSADQGPERGSTATETPAPAPTPNEPDAFDLGLTPQRAGSASAPTSAPGSSTAPTPTTEPPDTVSEPPGWSNEGSVAPRDRRSCPVGS